MRVCPYALGAWLGDGHSASARITTADPEIVVYLEAEGLRVVPHDGLLYNHSGTVQGILRSLGVLGLIVVIRTFLSFSLEVEINGHWPWEPTRLQQQVEADQRGDAVQPAGPA